jgi:hypothetical protein
VDYVWISGRLVGGSLVEVVGPIGGIQDEEGLEILSAIK